MSIISDKASASSSVSTSTTQAVSTATVQATSQLSQEQENARAIAREICTSNFSTCDTQERFNSQFQHLLGGKVSGDAQANLVREAIVTDCLKMFFDSQYTPSVEGLSVDNKLIFLQAVLASDRTDKSVEVVLTKSDMAIMKDIVALKPPTNFRTLTSKYSKETLDRVRSQIIDKLIMPLADKYAQALGLPKAKVRDSGTPGFDSDRDIAPIPDKDNPTYVEYIAMGKTALIATLITRALIGSENKLDLEFYNPHHGIFIQPPTTNDTEVQNIYQTGELAGVLLQARQQFSAEEFSEYANGLTSSFANGGFSEEAQNGITANYRQLATDCAGFSDFINGKNPSLSGVSSTIQSWCTTIGADVPDRKLAMANHLTDKMLELSAQAQQIEGALVALGRQVSPLKQQKEVELQRMQALIGRVGSFRAACYPEGYNSLASYKKVCAQDQEQVQENLAAQRKQNISPVKRADPPLQRSFTFSKFENFIITAENIVYYRHRKELIDASKYGPRAMDPLQASLEQRAEEIYTELCAEPSNSQRVIALQKEHTDVESLLEETRDLLPILQDMETLKRKQMVSTRFVVEQIAQLPQEDLTRSMHESFPEGSMSRIAQANAAAVVGEVDFRKSVASFVDIVGKDSSLFAEGRDRKIDEIVSDTALRNAFRIKGTNETNQVAYIKILKDTVKRAAIPTANQIGDAYRRVVEDYVTTANPQDRRFESMPPSLRVKNLTRSLSQATGRERGFSKYEMAEIERTALAVTQVVPEALADVVRADVKPKSDKFARQRVEAFKKKQKIEVNEQNAIATDGVLKAKCNQLMQKLLEKSLNQLVTARVLPVPKYVIENLE